MNVLKAEAGGGTFEIDGPIASALREYVSAIAVEEDNDLLRRDMLNYIVSCCLTIDNSAKAAVQAC
jgi:hypothetical protein